MTDQDWPLYEVFIRAKSGLSHRHAGSEIVASDPQESAALFEPAKDKIYRHPTFYDIPDGVENL